MAQDSYTITLNIPKWSYLVPGICIGVILAMALTTMANDTELDSDPRVFPYKGYLEFDGEPFAGNVDVQFTVTDDDSCSFTEEHDSVATYGGHFAVSIGSVEGDVPDCVFDSERVFIQVGVRNADSVEAYTTLSGSQRIYPVPFAYWAGEGSDMKIDGNATVGSNLVVMGNADLQGALDVGLDAEIEGQLTARNTTDIGSSNSGGGLIVGNPNGNNVRIDGNEIQRFSNGNTGALILNQHGGNINFGGNLLDVNDNTLNVGENLAIAGNATATGNVQGVNLTATGNATVEGQLFVDSGTRGIKFPDDPFGGNSDTAWIQYYQDGSGEDAALQIGIDNDGVDNIEFYQDGEVRMNIEGGDVEMTGDLEIGGTLKSTGQLLDYSEKYSVTEVGGNGYSSTVNLFVSPTDGFCYLSEVGIYDIENNEEYAGCRVFVDDDTWRAQSYGHSTRVNCEVNCVTWN